jgi:xanthine/CO dehydrogenase XdhC/CoxF family maturation factor
MNGHGHEEDPACEVAHTPAAPHAHAAGERTLAAVFASPVAGFLLRFAADLGYRVLLAEPDPVRREAVGALGLAAVAAVPADLDELADVVVTDHHRDELGVMLRDALGTKARWIGVMGSPRHAGPHIALLTDLGVSPAQIARVHRPIGLNIGSRTPPEIAIATLAGLLADRNSRPGGFHF